MSEEQNKVSFTRIGDLPIIVCVIESDDENFGVGFSVTTRARFRENLSTALAQMNAEKSLERRLQTMGERR